MPATRSPTKLIGAVTGLAAFIIAVVAGLSAGNDPRTVLTTALVAMAACAALGLAVGAVGEKAASEYIRAYVADRAGPAGRGDGAAAPASPPDRPAGP